MLKPFVMGVCCVMTVMGIARADEEAERAPEEFRVKFETSAGDFVVEVKRKWAPLGADRFHDLIQQGFYNDARFFRVVPNFVVQFGICGDPDVQRKWRDATIQDDPVVASNLRGYLTFATSGPNTRTAQLFISLRDNERLDEMGFAPFGRVIEGMETVDAITAEYGERPQQGKIQLRGNAYLEKEFPDMDFIKSATIMEDEEKSREPASE